MYEVIIKRILIVCSEEIDFFLWILSLVAFNRAVNCKIINTPESGQTFNFYAGPGQDCFLSARFWEFRPTQTSKLGIRPGRLGPGQRLKKSI